MGVFGQGVNVGESVAQIINMEDVSTYHENWETGYSSYMESVQKTKNENDNESTVGDETIEQQSMTEMDNVQQVSSNQSVVRDTFSDTSDYRLKEEDFPILTYTMGLPPIGAVSSGSSNTTLAEFDELEQIEKSFPILELTPNLVTVVKQDNKLRTKKVTSAKYRFACAADNAISYSHSNQYSASGIGQDLQKMMTLNTAHELRQLSYVSKNAIGDLMTAGLQDIQGSMSQIFETIEGYQKSKQPNSSMFKSLGSLGGDVIRSLLLGARIDFPNIWQNSQTAMTWTFNIELRTFATDPSSKEYQHDIINPMNALLTMSLPVGGFNLSYLEPPYLSAKMGNVLNVKLGAITNIQWSAPLTDFNFLQVPRHLQVTLTITDLYNVMMQGNNKSGQENDIQTKEAFLQNLGKQPSRTSVPNVAIWGNEFGLNSGEYKDAGQSNTTQANISTTLSTATTTSVLDNMYVSNMFKRFNVDKLSAGFDPSSNTMNMTLPDYGGFKAMSIPGVTDMFGNMDITSMYSGQTMDNMDIADFDLAITSFTPTSLKDISSLSSNTETKMNEFFTPSNVKKLTGDTMDTLPTSFVSSLGTYNSDTMTDVFTEFTDEVSDITTPLRLMDEVTRAVPNQLPNIIDEGTVDTDRLVRDVVNTIRDVDSVLDNKIRLDNSVQNMLFRACDNMSNSLQNSTVISDISAENDRINSENGLPAEEVSDQFKTAMTRCYNASSAVLTATNMNTIMTSKSGRTNSSRKCIVYANNNAGDDDDV